MPRQPRTPRAPRRPTSTGRTAVSAGTSAAGGTGIAAALYGAGVPGAIAAPVGLFAAGLLGAAAKWARDVNADRAHKGESPSLVHTLLAALGCVMLAFVVGGCAFQGKLGPGPYGWATIEYDIARTANLEAEFGPAHVCIGCFESGNRLLDPNSLDESGEIPEVPDE